MKNKSIYILLSLCCSLVISLLNENTLMAQDDHKKYVPVAYGEQEKSKQSISSYTISGDELLKTRATNIMVALQGKLPGLNILQVSGQPGNEISSKTIRGYNSGVKNSPLILVDGIERDPAGVDLFEVASVTVLKDAAATALYGMRGSGGVIIIKTRQGSDGKSKINITLDHSLQAPTALPDFVSAYDYAKMYNERVANDGSGTPYTDDELKHYEKGDSLNHYPTRDMLDDFIKDYSQMTRVNINFSGGSDMMRFFTSLGYQHQGSMFENEAFDVYSYDSEIKSDRFNFRTNLDMKVNETLDAWVYVGGFLENVNGPKSSATAILQKLYRTPNNAYNDLTPDGEVVAKLNQLEYQTKESVYGMLNRTGSVLNTETRIGNTVGARQDLSMLTEGLSITGQVAFDVFSRKILNRTRSYESYQLEPDAQDSLVYKPISGTKNSVLGENFNLFFKYMYNFKGVIDYEREFGDHYVSGMLFGESQMAQQEIYLPTYFVTTGLRASYAYQNKYIAELNMAYQGSEQFAKGKRFGLFPSLSLAWVASNESFLEDYDQIDFLKIRASVGQNGNSVYNYGAKNQYLYVTTWNTNATEDKIGNEDISWETSTKANFGIDAQLFNSLYVGLDLFYNDNKDLIVTDLSSIPSGMSGLTPSTLPPANIGYGTNKGFEFYLAYAKEFSSGLNLMLSGNISGTKNQIDYVGELPFATTGPNKYAYDYRVAGYPLGMRWGYLSDGLFDDQDDIDAWYDQKAVEERDPVPGDIKYKDITGDGIVNDQDVAPLDLINHPSYYYGAMVQLDYNGFDFNLSVVGVADRQVYLSGSERRSYGDNFTEYMKNAWTAENPTSDQYPRLSQLTPNNAISDYWIENGAFVRVKNIEIGYTFPKTIASGNLRIYANAINSFVFHSLPNNDFDPEPSSSSYYPIMKVINLGVNMRF